MSRRAVGEPRLARWLLRRLLPEHLREPVLADLGEDYRMDRRSHGRLVADVRYWLELGAPSIWTLRREARSRAAEGALPRGSGGSGPVRGRRPPLPARPSRVLGGLWSELRYAARALCQTPGFTLAAAATLALGLGATTFVFTVFDSVLTQPLPYAESDRIATIWADLGDGAQSLPAVNALDVVDYREWSTTFEEFAVATGQELILTGDEPEIVDTARVSANFFPFLGVEPALGRNFATDEDAPGGPRVAILSHGLWSRRYGAAPDAVGKTVELEGVPHAVVGVLPPDFRLLLPPEAFLLRDADLWRPLQMDPERMPPRNYTGYTVFGRLAPGESFDRAQEDMEAVAARLRETYPVHADANTKLRAVPLHHDVVKDIAPALRLLMGAVGIVLLVVCANVAHLLLVRGTSRDRELAVRTALGAGRGRVTLGFLLESLLLGGVGAVGGVGLAAWGLELLAGASLTTIPRLGAVELDTRVLAFVVTVSLVTILLSSLAPLLRGMRTDPVTVLREGDRGATGSGGQRLRSALVVAEVALSLMLLVGAGLLLRSFVALQGADAGFEPEGVLTFRASLPALAEEYRSADGREAFFSTLRDRLAGLPGVASVAAVSQLPLTGSGPLQPFAHDEETARNWESVTADERWVLEGFFETMGATLVAGRGFSAADRADAPRVVVVDERLAAMAWPGESAVGKRLQIEPEGVPESFVEVVGVVRHLRLHDLSREGLPQIYAPYRQGRGRLLSFAVRVAGGDPGDVVQPVRRVVAELDERVALDDVRSLQGLLDASLERARLSLWLMVGFGTIAVILVSVGVYGVISWTLASRTREMGVRLALGADPRRLRRDVLRQGLTLVAPSLLLGAALAVAFGRFLEGLLYGVAPLDPPTFLVVAGLLTAVAALACWVPARRVSRIDPLDAMHAE